VFPQIPPKLAFLQQACFDIFNAPRYIVIVPPYRLFAIAILCMIFVARTLKASEPTSSLNSRWSIEGSFQAHSVAGPSSPWMGFGPLFRIFDSTQLGIRGFVPVNKAFDNSTYSLQSFLRLRLCHGTRTDLFIEPDYAMNFYTLLPFSSYGLAVGALNRINQDFAVGVSGGIESAQVVVDSIGLERRNTWIIYPKISFFANFNL